MVTKVICCCNFQQCLVIINCNLGQLTKPPRAFSASLTAELGKSLKGPLPDQSLLRIEPQGQSAWSRRSHLFSEGTWLSYVSICEEVGPVVAAVKAESFYLVIYPSGLSFWCKWMLDSSETTVGIDSRWVERIKQLLIPAQILLLVKGCSTDLALPIALRQITQHKPAPSTASTWVFLSLWVSSASQATLLTCMAG